MALSKGKKNKTAADVQRELQAKEQTLRGSEQMRAALSRPGSLLFLSDDVVVGRRVKHLDVLERGPTRVPHTHPSALKKGALLLYVGIERVEDVTSKGTVRRPYYTFLLMGVGHRSAIVDLTLLRTTAVAAR